MKNRDVKLQKNTKTVLAFLRAKALGIGGLIESEINPLVQAERLTFVNNINQIREERLREYNIWYTGDSDELLNYYTRANAIDYNMDPLYNRGKKSYYWAVSSTEGDIKHTHSGQPRNVVDTLVGIIGIPQISVGSGQPDSVLVEPNRILKGILRANNFDTLLKQKARPLTLVEGWGGWKINWDTSFSEYPILLYYRAGNIDYIKRSNQIIGIVYRDYFQDEKGNNYILFETRYLSRERNESGKYVTNLIIDKELFKITDSEIIIPCKLTDLVQLKDVKPRIKVSNFNRLLGGPNVYFYDNTEDFDGRSIFTGKLDLFDDLDQCLSQSANAVRRSTVIEYFNTLFLEKDQHTGIPIMPKAFDRKYVQYSGGKNADGSTGGMSPVQVTQPTVNFQQYSQQAVDILLQIISGIMSPATLGIDVAKKDNAQAQREKEKVTIFTRNFIIAEETKCLESVMNDLLCAYELMNSADNAITCKDYDISIKYDEFADASFEAKLETVLTGWQAGLLSDEMAVDYLWGDSISKEERVKCLDFLKEQRDQQAQMSQMGNLPEDQGEFGELGAENEYNTAHEHANIDDTKEDLGVPNLTDYDAIHNK